MLKEKIKDHILGFCHNDPTESAISLLKTLGYYSTPNHLPDKTPETFQDYFANDSFSPQKARTPEWEHIDLLFQLTSQDLSECSGFSSQRVDNQLIESYIFFTLKLSSPGYNRTTLAQITREINKLFLMPAMVIFQYGNNITLSVINRRIHKKDPTKDVLEKVTLIKDINMNAPHRAHIDVLHDLCLVNLRKKYTINNWSGLHKAWQDTLNTEELNKRFYSDISHWYFWALKKTRFPDSNVPQGLIRLLTRLLFVWFIKEKDLIPFDLFSINRLKDILIDFSPRSSESLYYKAILQNLFFATLNQDIKKGNSEKKIPIIM